MTAGRAPAVTGPRQRCDPTGRLAVRSEPDSEDCIWFLKLAPESRVRLYQTPLSRIEGTGSRAFEAGADKLP